MTTGIDDLGQIKGTLIDLAIRFGPKVLAAIVILVAGSFTAGWVAKTVARGLHRFDLEPPVRMLLTRVARVLVLGLFVIMALQNLGVELLPLIAGLSVAGAGIALATQGVLSNLVAGLMIIFSRPYRVGEYVEIVGVDPNGQAAAKGLSAGDVILQVAGKPVSSPREVKAEIEAAIGEAKTAIEGNDPADMTAKTQALTEKAMKMGQAIYEKEQASAAAPGGAGAEAHAGADDVVDAEFSEVDEKKG